MWEGWAGGLGSGGPGRATRVVHLSARCSLEAAGYSRSWTVLAQDTFLLIMSLGTVGRQAAGYWEPPKCGLGIGLGVCRLAGGDPRDPACVSVPGQMPLEAGSVETDAPCTVRSG